MSEERLPLPEPEAMTEAQRDAVEQLLAGPRKGVKGPFIPLLRSPLLLMRLEKVGEYLRFDSALPPRIAEFATLVVSRAWTQQFEWATHVPLALKAGTERATIDELRDGRRPASMSEAEALVHDFISELSSSRDVSQATFDAIVLEWGEQGLVDLVGIVGYFTLMAMVLNVAHTPRDAGSTVDPLPASEHAAIAAVLDLYVAGARLGQGATMKPAFHPEATILGHVGDAPWGGAIETLFEHVDRDGPAPGIRCRIASVDVVGDVATARVEIDDWNGRRYTDVFTLLKTDGAWKIVNKVFHRHS